MIGIYIHENKGKSLLIAGIVLMWVVLFALYKGYGYNETWELWGVPTLAPIFRDFQLIPGSAESFRHGFEPTDVNPYDVGGRIFNYPAFWRLFFYTNISMDDTVWIIVLLLILYFISVILFPQKIAIRDALLMLLVVFSPASMLLYERGNADLFVFFICAMAVLATDYSASLAASLIVFGAIVKMFPLFGVTILLKESRSKFWTLAGICILFMLVYGWITIDSQSTAWNTTMRGDGLSYGTFVIITRLGDHVQQALPNLLSLTQWQLAFEIIALIIILLIGVMAIREPLSLTAPYERNLAAFRMGASIYLGTFMLGNNWDYRLAFLVFTVPQLSQWFSAENKRHKFTAITAMGLIFLSCWHLMLKIDIRSIPLKDPVNRNFLLDEFFNWLLVPGFAYLLVASFPAWLKSDLQKVIGRGRKYSAEESNALGI